MKVSELVFASEGVQAQRLFKALSAPGDEGSWLPCPRLLRQAARDDQPGTGSQHYKKRFFRMVLIDSAQVYTGLVEAGEIVEEPEGETPQARCRDAESGMFSASGAVFGRCLWTTLGPRSWVW